jgi:hypothetical protein
MSRRQGRGKCGRGMQIEARKGDGGVGVGVGGADAGAIGHAYGNGSVGFLDVGVGAVTHEIVAGDFSVGLWLRGCGSGDDSIVCQCCG